LDSEGGEWGGDVFLPEWGYERVIPEYGTVIRKVQGSPGQKSGFGAFRA